MGNHGNHLNIVLFVKPKNVIKVLKPDRVKKPTVCFKIKLYLVVIGDSKQKYHGQLNKINGVSVYPQLFFKVIVH